MAPSSMAVPDGSSPESKLEDSAEAGLSPSAAAAEEEEDHHVYPDLSVPTQVMITLTLTLSMTLNICQTQAPLLALEAIGRDLNILTTNLQWISSAYSLAFGALLLLFGRLADIYGHKTVFLAGMGWAVVWSVAAGVAQNEISLDIFRAMQGAGMGAAIPSALGILGSSFPPSQAKSTAFATFSAGAPLGGSIGSVIGGVLTQYAPIGWRAVFHVMAGNAALVMIGAFIFVPADKDRDTSLTVDWLGGFLITAGLTLVTFTLADGSGQVKGWRTPYIAPLFCVGILLLIAFWFWERHLEYKTDRAPLMKTSLWFKGRFFWVQIIGALGWSAFASFMFFCTLWYQDFLGLSPVLATVRFLPSPATGLVLNAVVAIMASRVPAQYMIVLGTLGTGLAPLLFALQDNADPYWQWQFPAMILSVFGADFIFATGIMYVSKLAGPGEQALAGGLFNCMTMVGTCLGLAINTIIQARVTQAKVEAEGGVYDANQAASPYATQSGLRGAFFGCAGFAFGALVIAMAFLHGIGKVGHRIRSPKVEEAGVAAEKEEKGL